jgi:hypothetical protein
VHSGANVFEREDLGLRVRNSGEREDRWNYEAEHIAIVQAAEGQIKEQSQFWGLGCGLLGLEVVLVALADLQERSQFEGITGGGPAPVRGR